MVKFACIDRAVCAALFLSLGFATTATAQFMGNAGQNGNSLPQQLNNGQNVIIPSPIVPNGQFTPQQMQNMMMMRAMAGRRNNVRTGYPQMVPSWGPGAGMPSLMPVDDPPAAAADGSPAQKRVEAKRQREEQKKAAREAAKGKGKPDKTEKAAKAKADKQAKADKKAGKKAAAKK